MNSSLGSIVYLNNGTGAFVAAGPLFGAPSHRGVLGDLDRDGDLDALTAHYPNGTTIWLNDGSGGLSLNGPLGGPYSLAVSLGDPDRDRDLDAFVACGNPVPGAPVKLFRNDTATATQSKSWGALKGLFSPRR